MYDLCFVVAVAQISSELHHLLVERRFADGVIGFSAAFFGIWWAWVNYVWFASGHDSDDVPFRLLTLVQMAGVLVLAAGVHDAMEHFDFTTMTIGYVVMRLGLVGMWLRVARDQPAHRQRAMRYVIGISAVQVLWLLRLALPEGRPIGVGSFVVLAFVELAIPIWAERVAPAPQFHPGHIAERFGLFTIIVLGEVILSSTIAVREAIDAVGLEFDVLVVAAAALVIAFAVWWSYFGRDDEPEVDRLHGAFFWGYGHLPVFAGLAAFGAGVHVAVEAAAGSADVTDRLAALAITVPLAVAITGFAISVANARSIRERRLLPVEAVKFAVVLLLGLLAPMYVALVGTAVLFVAGTILQGIVLERRLGVEVATIVSNDDAIEAAVRQRVGDLSTPGVDVVECDPAFADTAAFCATYGYAMEDSANAIVVIGKSDPPRFAVCVVLATTRLDVNKTVRARLGTRKASFAPAETTTVLTGMTIGGVTPFAVPADVPIWIDAAVMHRERVVVGGGSRRCKVVGPPAMLLEIAGVEVVDGLAT